MPCLSDKYIVTGITMLKCTCYKLINILYNWFLSGNLDPVFIHKLWQERIFTSASIVIYIYNATIRKLILRS